MNFKLFKPLNEQIQVIKIKRQGIADSEREELIESIINGDAVESLTEDVELVNLYEKCLAEANFDEARADELFLEALDIPLIRNIPFTRNQRIARLMKKKEEKETIKNPNRKEREVYQDIARSHAEEDQNRLNDINRDFEQARDDARRSGGSNRAFKLAEKNLKKNLIDFHKSTLKRNKNEAKHKKRSEKTEELLQKTINDNKKNVEDHKLDNSYNNREGENKFSDSNPESNNYYNHKLHDFIPKDNSNETQENPKPKDNRDEEFEKRVNDEVSKRYQAKLDEYKKEQERIKAERKAARDANRAKKAAEAQATKEPVKETASKGPVVATPKPEEPKHEEPVKETASKDPVVATPKPEEPKHEEPVKETPANNTADKDKKDE